MSLPPRSSLAFTSRPGLFSCVAALASAFLAAPALAERWVDALPASGAALLQWDADSVAAAGTNRFDVTWRAGMAPGRPYFLKRGVVDCAAASLQIATSTWVETDPGRGRYGGAVTDYAAGTRTWQGRTTRLTAAERAERSEFPAPGDAAGRLVELVCGERAAATTLQALDLRLAQVQQACALSTAQTAGLRALAPADDCARSATGCSAPALQAALAGLGSDLARAAAGQACVYVPEALERVAGDAAERDATARFQACVARSIPALDDRVSQADVIAQGVFGACRGELPAEIAQGPAFANGLLPGLTAAVLKYRNTGRVTLPTKPGRSQAD